jgi:hypothetical protein
MGGLSASGRRLTALALEERERRAVVVRDGADSVTSASACSGFTTTP